MWTSALDSAGGFLTALALLLTAIGTVALAAQKLFRPTPSEKKAAAVVTTGQMITAEPRWLVDLRQSAARVPHLEEETDELETEVKHLRARLDTARMRLAQNDLQYDDLY